MSLVILLLASLLAGPQDSPPQVAETEPSEIDQSVSVDRSEPQSDVVDQADPARTADTAAPIVEPQTAVADPKPSVIEPHTSAAEPALREYTEPDTVSGKDLIADIPAFLSSADAKLYRRVFALQKAGKITEAKKVAAGIDNKMLMGHVLAQRLQRTRLPSYKELRSWMRKYADHPDFHRIKRLAQARKKGRSKSKRPPYVAPNTLMASPPPSAPYRTRKNLTRKQRKRVSSIKRAARIWLRKGQITRTERLLQRGYVVRLLDRYEMSEVRGKVAAAWYYHGRYSRAYRLAKQVIARSGKKLPVTHWIAGLASWRMGKIQQALGHFEKLAVAPQMTGWIGAGGALWAARAHKKLGNQAENIKWLEAAAQHPYTLYGILALKELGREIPVEPREFPLTAAKLKLLASTQGGQRALALTEVGELLRAEQELLKLKEWKRRGMDEALRAIAERFQLPSIGIKLVHHQAKDDDGRAGEPIDPAIYPVPPWKASKKSGIDQALLLAIMRQESDFNAYAHSPVGALGLMQIMPNTARMLNRGRRPFSGARRLDQYDPYKIVKFGEKYLVHLRRHKLIRNDLIRVIAAYNSGPGNINYWAREKIKNKKDPLLFIESIPNLETRLFTRRVLANLWIYRHRLNQRAPSLEAFSAGRFPRYRPIDGKGKRRATAEFPPHRGG
jgi:soluble lytic murein transglycosylase-like protein